MVDRRRVIRGVCLAIVLVSILLLAQSYVTASDRPTTDGSPSLRPGAPPAIDTPTPRSTPRDLEGTPTLTPTPGILTPTPASIGVESRLDRSTLGDGGTVPPADDLTVVATQGFFVSDETAELVVFTEGGEVVYHDDRYESYFDVDPVPGTTHTVEYVVAAQIAGDACEDFDPHWCTRNVVERVNLSTGSIETVLAHRNPKIYGTRWHDVDRINDTHRVLANIDKDTVEVVDVRSGTITWRWHASALYNRSQGGKEGDWTHVNDVEVLDDGRLMVSVRNMDEVIFLRPGEGVLENQTLGTDQNHDVLYEQHNPDYIPPERGGPAVVVADSENNRILEFHREEGNWTKAWQWRDARLQWPRDADRLPNGNTLVVDTHGDRVVEVAPNGTIVWSVHVGMGYDAERLGTGDESAGGHAYDTGADAGTGVDGAATAGPTVGLSERLLIGLKDVLPSVAVNGLLYLAPSWVRFTDLLVAGVLLTTIVVRIGFAWRWSDRSVRGTVGGARTRFLQVLRR
jgi:hypothetical protein